MYNNCLVEWRTVTESNKQHGYLPGRGILTAWTELTSMLLKPNIYEADFEKFFDNVAHVGIRFILKDFLHFPFTEVQFVNQLNESLVQLQKKDKIEEKDRAVQLDKEGEPNPQADRNQDPRIVSGHAYLEYTENPGVYKSL